MPTIYHTYASVGDLRDFLAGTNYSSNWTADTSALRRILAAASRRIDDYVGGDGLNTFGPYIETKKYDIGIGPLGQTLVQTGLRTTGLRNDVRPMVGVNTMAPAAKVLNIIPLGSWLSSATTVTSYGDTAQTTSETLTEGYNADYFLEPYNTNPKFTLKLNEDTNKGFNGGQQTLHIAGTWGWQNTTSIATTLNGAITDAAATTVTVTSGATLSEGNTILVGTEQMYVESISTNNLTVIRGVHGTTAATHLTGVNVAKYTYSDVVVQACLDLGHFSYRDRDIGFNDSNESGATGDAMTALETLDRFASHTNTSGVIF
tara:strand:- start:3667 stop:4617 length:951 start_codon:yes stop_codon:yes gene_type:complete